MPYFFKSFEKIKNIPILKAIKIPEYPGMNKDWFEEIRPFFVKNQSKRWRTFSQFGSSETWL